MSNATLRRLNEPVRILRTIRKTVPGMIIAGGYHRDMYHNKKFGDIDMFVSYDQTGDLAEDIYEEDFWADMFNLKHGSFFSLDNIRKLGPGDEGYEGIPNVGGVFKLSKNEVEYNIVIVGEDDPKQYVMKHFDYNLCKVYCDGEKITFTREFISDSENRTLTFTNEKTTDKNFARSVEVHYPKIKKKYPDFELQMPEACLARMTKLKIFTPARFIAC